MRLIEHEVWINAGRAAVFEAISTREGLDGWWGPVARADSGIGSLVEFDHGHGDLLRMRITDFADNERVAWECISNFSEPGNPASEWTGTRILFDLRDGERTGFGPIDSHFPVDPFTILRFEHAGWPEGTRWLAFCNYAWGVTLAGLSEYCEGTKSHDG